MSNFENLRKQARQILKWHREGHWPVAEQIRGSLPGFRNMTDREILDHDFQLADAQALIAVRAGYRDWSELKLALVQEDQKPSTGAGATPHMDWVEPCLLVSDIQTTCNYFETRLGFDILFTYGNPPFYGAVERDNVRLAMRQVDRYIIDNHTRRNTEEELLSASVAVQALESIYQEFVDAEVDFFQALRVEPWGRKSFIVRDPDGNLIAFHSSG